MNIETIRLNIMAVESSITALKKGKVTQPVEAWKASVWALTTADQEARAWSPKSDDSRFVRDLILKKCEVLRAELDKLPL